MQLSVQYIKNYFYLCLLQVGLTNVYINIAFKYSSTLTIFFKVNSIKQFFVYVVNLKYKCYRLFFSYIYFSLTFDINSSIGINGLLSAGASSAIGKR